MSKRSDPGTNWKRHAKGKISRFYFQEEFEIDKKPTRFSLKWLLPLLPISLFCTAVILAIVVASQETQQPSSEVESPKVQAFRWAVNRAMNAAELTQIASTEDEWSEIADWWREAIDLMRVVPRSHPQYKLAQQKITEYQHNLEYAQVQAETRPEPALPTSNLWSVGARRIDVVRIQGQPSQAVRYDALCQEVLHYGNSTVELNNGIVAAFDDIDKNLKASPETIPTASVQGDRYSWTLGSNREDVFRIQGTPDRVAQYSSLHKETLFYDNSTIELTDNKVTSYSNLSQNLQVAILTIATGTPEEASGYWTVGSERNTVFRIQGTPTQVQLDNSMCREVLHYSNSTIELRNGFVTGYDNLDGNLSVNVN